MGKIKGWKKIGKMSWASEKGSWHCCVVKLQGKLTAKNKWINLREYKGILERRGRLISESLDYGNKTAAFRWCTHTMKRIRGK